MEGVPDLDLTKKVVGLAGQALKKSHSAHLSLYLLFAEFVEVLLLPLNEFQTKIDELINKDKIIVDAKVYIYAMGMVQAFFKPRELPVLKQ